MRLFVLLLLLLPLPASLIPAAACSPRARPFDVARVGVVAPLTGERAEVGREVVDAVRLAMEEWNGAGGVHGLHLELVTLDSADPATPSRLKADPRLALVAGYPDPAGAAAGRVAFGGEADPAAVLLASPGSGVEAAGILSMMPTTEQIAEVAAAAVAFNFGPTSVAVVASGTDDGIAAAQAFVRAAPARGLQVRANLTLAAEEVSYTRVATAVRASGAAVLYVAGRGYDAGGLWAEIRPRDARLRLIMSPGTLDSGFIRTAGGFFEGVLALEPFDRPADLPSAQPFIRSFTGRFGYQPSTLAARAYDAATVALRAVASASDGHLPARPAVRAALGEETGLDGVLGAYRRDHGALTTNKLALYRLDHDGALVLIGEPELR